MRITPDRVTMRSIARVFGRSPFVPLQDHMEKVAECVRRVPEILEAYKRDEQETVRKLMKLISKLEHEADLVKHDIRNSLPRGLFMPVDRGHLLHILSVQDNLADRAENIAVLLSFKKARMFDSFPALFDGFVVKSMEAFEGVHRIIGQLDELLESGFGGGEAQKVKEMVDEVALREYESDCLQRDLVRELFQHEDELSYGDFFLWTRVIRQVAGIANHAENLADSVRATLESK